MFGKIILLVSAVLLLSSCPSTSSGLSINKPEGFAVVETAGSDLFSAISPEGIFFNVKTTENYPVKDIDFWGNSLKNQFINNGYQLYSEKEITAENGNNGILFEWLAPYSSKTFIYSTYIILDEESIIIAEAAGEVKLFADYRQSILESIKTISFLNNN